MFYLCRLEFWRHFNWDTNGKHTDKQTRTSQYSATHTEGGVNKFLAHQSPLQGVADATIM